MFTPQHQQDLSLPARIAIAALAVLGEVGGWLILVNQGFHQGRKHSKETIFIDGPSALLMAALFLIMAAVAVAALLQAQRESAAWYVTAGLATVVLPVTYVLMTWGR